MSAAFLVMVVVAGGPSPTPEETEEHRRRGFHCLSGWDGSHPRIARLVKERMNDPGSFEHVETRVTPADGAGRHKLYMKFRGRNAFGGLVVNRAVGSYGRMCAAELERVE